MLFHELRHIEAHHRLFVVEEKFRQRPAQFGFTDAGRTEKDKRADRPVLVLQAGASAAHGVGHGVNRVVLTDDAQLQAIFHLEQFLNLAFEHLRNRDAGPFRDDFGDVFGVDLFLEHLLIFLQLGELSVRLFQILLQLGQSAVAQLGGAVQITFALRLLLFDLGRFELFLERANALDRFLFVLPVGFETARGFVQIFDLAFQLRQPLFGRFVFLAFERLALDFELENFTLHLVDFDRHAVDLDAQPRGRFVDQIDRFVGQEAVADIAVRTRWRRR